jgi:imidazolonepropionase-like amidohydrolase
MNHLRRTGALVAAALLCILSMAATGEPIAFVGVDVVPMDSERILVDQTVLIDDGRIVTIGPAASTEIPTDALKITGTGRYLLPGLTEMHAHIPSLGRGRGWVDDVLFLFVANGVTTARGMLGEPFHLELREQTASGQTLGPRIYTSGPSLNGRSVDGPAAARQMVEQQAKAGYDFLKLHPGLSLEEFEAIAEAANRMDIPFAGHVSQDVGLARALEAGQATIDHLDGFMQALLPPGSDRTVSAGFFGAALIDRVDVSRIPELAKATRDANVGNVPTQTLMDNLALPDDPDEMAARPEMSYVPRDMLESWIRAKRNAIDDPNYDPADGKRFIEIRRAIIKSLRNKGAEILLGSDAPQIFNVPGFSIHYELQAMVDAGLTPYEALRSGTASPAVFFGASDRFGTVAQGIEADLILVDANPLEDVSVLRKPVGVMRGGRWLARAELDSRLATLARKYRQ